MAKAVFDELAKDQPKNHFTVGIVDDVSHTSLEVDPRSRRSRTTCPGGVLRARRRRDGERQQELGEDHRRGYRPLRAGLLRLRLEEVGLDDHLAPAVRAAPHPLDVPDRPGQANFVACHQFSFLERLDVLEVAAPGATFLLNSPFGPETVWDRLPVETQQDDPREAAPVLRRRRPEGRDGGGTRLAREHDPADVLLRPRGRPRPGRGRGADQGRDREELRQARALRRGAELRGGGRRARRAARGSRAVRRGPAICIGCRRSPKRPPTSSSA